MKKIIALLLVAMLLLGLTGTALAYDEEITWQGVPWNGNINEIVETIEQKGVTNIDINVDGSVWSMDYVGILQNNENQPVNYDFVNYYRNGTIVQGKYSQIAGYDVDYIHFCFLFGADENGLNKDDTVLQQINIHLKDINERDISAKLSAIYGDPISFLEGYIWYGAEDTAVCLLNAWLSGHWFLIYGKTDAVQVFQNQLDIINGIAKPTQTVDPNNSSGL